MFFSASNIQLKTRIARIALCFVLTAGMFYVSAPAYGKTTTNTATKSKTTKAKTSKSGTAKTKPKNTSASKTKKNTAKTPERKSGDVRKDKQRNEKEIAETRKKISENEKRTRDKLNQLSNLDSQIERQVNTIEELNQKIVELEEKSVLLSDSVKLLKYQDSILCKNVAVSFRRQRMQRHRITPLTFIAASKSVKEARQRISYLTEVRHANTSRVNTLRRQRQTLNMTLDELDSVQTSQNIALKQLSTAKIILDERRAQSQKAVNDLRRESATLNKVLQEKQKRARQLDDELTRVIAEEQRKAEEAARRERERQKKQQQQQGKQQKSPQEKASSQSQNNKKSTPPASSKPQGVADADRELSGTFAANKGHLLFPVAGKYTISGTFGRSQHDKLSHVQVDNSGIDISVSPGTKARAVFDGTVSSVFFMNGYENIVIIRHGEYLTVYAGITSLNVSKGSKVKAGQNIGTVATIDGSTALHFEVRKERAKLNPLQWVR